MSCVDTSRYLKILRLQHNAQKDRKTNNSINNVRKRTLVLHNYVINRKDGAIRIVTYYGCENYVNYLHQDRHYLFNEVFTVERYETFHIRDYY